MVKWKGWESKHNTKEPEAHLVACSVLLSYWKGKKKSKPQEQQLGWALSNLRSVSRYVVSQSVGKSGQ